MGAEALKKARPFSAPAGGRTDEGRAAAVDARSNSQGALGIENTSTVAASATSAAVAALAASATSANAPSLLQSHVSAASCQSQSHVSGSKRPKTAPPMKRPSVKPKFVSRESPVVAELRKGQLRMALVPESAAWIYMQSEYRREYPRRIIPAEDAQLKANSANQKYKPTAP